MNKYHDYHNYCLLTESIIHIMNCQLNGKSNDISLNFRKKVICNHHDYHTIIAGADYHQEKYMMSIITNKIIKIIAIIE